MFVSDFNNRCLTVAILTLSDKHSDFPKLAEKLSIIRTDRHENLVRPKKYFAGPKKKSQEFTVACIMFSLAFLEWFTLVLAIGHLISPLVFIEVKVIQFSVFSVVQNCICYVFYSLSRVLLFWWPCTIGQWLYERRHVIG